jgi:putative cardiolipin synthase
MIRKNLSISHLVILALFLVVGCATLPENFVKPESYAYTDTDDTRMGRARRDEINAHPGQSGFLLLGNGLDAFLARALLAENAERSIDAQYYLYHDDLIGRLFTDLLLKAANRGVRVRLLVDDMDLEGRNLGPAVADSHPNMDVRIFNPFSRKTSRIIQFVTRSGSVTRRMHNKSFTVDNQVTILGGRNIGDEYFEADPDLAFSDLDVVAIGPVVKEVSASFDKYWNDELAYPAIALRGKEPTPQEIERKHQQLYEFIEQQRDSTYLQSLNKSDLANTIRRDQVRYHWGEADVIYDQPEKIQHDFDKTQYHLAPKLKPYFEGVTQELIIFSPYFVPGKSGTALLQKLCERGVRVRIITNSLGSNDVAIVHSGYSKYRKDMLRAGVELYEMNKKLTKEQRKKKKGRGGSSKVSLHAKSFVFDRKHVFIGSLNLDPRAIHHNTEIGVVVASREIADELAERFDQNVEKEAFRLELKKERDGTDKIVWHGLVDGEQKVFNVEPHSGFWQRLWIDLLKILPIESQL